MTEPQCRYCGITGTDPVCIRGHEDNCYAAENDPESILAREFARFAGRPEPAYVDEWAARLAVKALREAEEDDEE